MDLQRMLDKCHRDQWSIDDLDWNVKPRPMPADMEMAVVQYFTDMAAIERLAGALFQQQRRRTRDPVLAEIFETFVVDEVRHSQVAQRLADHYDVHHLKPYTTNAALTKFTPAFYAAVQYLSPEVANAYITGGEMILDVALLRSLNDYVDDAMSHQAMDKINRDESRHIAVDFHMVEYYASPAYKAKKRSEPQEPTDALRAAAAFARVILHGKPFFDDVFFEPMRRTDPGGKRLREAMKRMQLLRNREHIKDSPFNAFLLRLTDLYEKPLFRRTLGPLLLHIAGLEDGIMRNLFSAEELAAAQRKSVDELAEEAVGLKYAS